MKNATYVGYDFPARLPKTILAPAAAEGSTKTAVGKENSTNMSN